MNIYNKIYRDLYAPLTKIVHESWALLFPKWYVKYLYKKVTNRKLDLKNPKDHQEKIQWLKVYADTSQWTNLADKYKVREYVSQCGLSDNLIELYGVWERAEEIDFSKLPEKFVLKTNHGFKKVILVEDKSKLDISKTIRLLNTWVKEKYGLVTFEPHYWKIERRIIAEAFLQDSSISNISSSLIDYKFFCFNGEPEIIMTLSDRPNMSIGSTADTNPKLKYNIYDIDWNTRPEVISASLAIDIAAILPKPNRLDEMLRICKILSKPFPQVRVDLYEVNNKVYFGEMTFTSGGGMQSFTREYSLELGRKMDISRVKRKAKRYSITKRSSNPS